MHIARLSPKVTHFSHGFMFFFVSLVIHLTKMYFSLGAFMLNVYSICNHSILALNGFTLLCVSLSDHKAPKILNELSERSFYICEEQTLHLADAPVTVIIC